MRLFLEAKSMISPTEEVTMPELQTSHTVRSLDSAEVSLKQVLTRRDVVGMYRLAELVTLARDGSPVCWPMAPEFERERLCFSTGFAYPTKARNAQREPRIAALFSDPTGTNRSDNDPLVLVQGLAEVFDSDLQRNTERYVDQLLRKGPPMRLLLRVPVLRQFMVGYLARIWIEMTPSQEYIWPRVGTPPGSLRKATRPATFSPGKGIALPEDVFAWLPRYTRPPVLAYLDERGWPAATRVQATVQRGHIAFETGLEASDGAPACLTYHRMIGNYSSNDAFIIRGHFDAAGRLVPEKVVGFVGTADDRGLGSLKLMRLIWELRGQLADQLKREGRPLPIVRPPSGR
jgi:hypothetical protein